MRLVEIQYSEYPGTAREWRLERVNFSSANLIVGQNATGKTRTLNLIQGLAKLIAGDIKLMYQSGVYDAIFQSDRSTWKYHLEYDNAQVTNEELELDGQNVLHRGQGNLGHIVAEDVDGKSVRIKFKGDAKQLAVLSKRDAAQHSYLEPLHDWALRVRHFPFGGEMGALAVAVKGPIPVNERDTSQLIAILDKALRRYNQKFKDMVIADMAAMGYSVEDFEIRTPTGGVFLAVPGDVVGVALKETELKSATDQPVMSTGMFRSLSLIIQTAYFTLENSGGCFLVDDIGDGLDFERACKLIDLLRRKAKDAAIQLILTTNNRFIMNKVPLEEWCVLKRTGHIVSARNYSNSRNAFDEFKLTGLNNFELLATDFLSKVNADG